MYAFVGTQSHKLWLYAKERDSGQIFEDHCDEDDQKKNRENAFNQSYRIGQYP